MMRLMYVRFHRSYTTTNCCIATLIACVAMETFTFKPDEMSYLKLEIKPSHIYSEDGKLDRIGLDIKYMCTVVSKIEDLTLFNL